MRASAEAAARRECREEIGVAPRALLRVFSYLPTPGVTDERCTLFLALVDSAEVPARAGLADETEATHPFTVPVAEALAAVEAGTAGNLFLISAPAMVCAQPCPHRRIDRRPDLNAILLAMTGMEPETWVARLKTLDPRSRRPRLAGGRQPGGDRLCDGLESLSLERSTG